MALSLPSCESDGDDPHLCFRPQLPPRPRIDLATTGRCRSDDRLCCRPHDERKGMASPISCERRAHSCILQLLLQWPPVSDVE
eukprot:1342699-Prymnesium_polylepis.1